MDVYVSSPLFRAAPERPNPSKVWYRHARRGNNSCNIERFHGCSPSGPITGSKPEHFTALASRPCDSGSGLHVVVRNIPAFRPQVAQVGTAEAGGGSIGARAEAGKVGKARMSSDAAGSQTTGGSAEVGKTGKARMSGDAGGALVIVVLRRARDLYEIVRHTGRLAADGLREGVEAWTTKGRTLATVNAALMGSGRLSGHGGDICNIEEGGGHGQRRVQRGGGGGKEERHDQSTYCLVQTITIWHFERDAIEATFPVGLSVGFNKPKCVGIKSASPEPVCTHNTLQLPRIVFLQPFLMQLPVVWDYFSYLIIAVGSLERTNVTVPGNGLRHLECLGTGYKPPRQWLGTGCNHTQADKLTQSVPTDLGFFRHPPACLMQAPTAAVHVRGITFDLSTMLESATRPPHASSAPVMRTPPKSRVRVSEEDDALTSHTISISAIGSSTSKYDGFQGKVPKNNLKFPDSVQDLRADNQGLHQIELSTTVKKLASYSSLVEIHERNTPEPVFGGSN
ncbi:hypothetical protein FB451DRAFT_1195515 [Mycena latifolia]|nr:hypothetical protein FB451DRAFT_1195515 [Mycena latifolia]